MVYVSNIVSSCHIKCLIFFPAGEDFVNSIMARKALGGQVRLEDVKKKLQVKFEHDIFELAEFLSSREAEAWERLNARFKNETDTSNVAEKLKQHELKQVVVSPALVPEPVQEEERGRGRGATINMRKQSSFGKKDDGRRRTLSPSRSFSRSNSKSPRAPTMKETGGGRRSPQPGPRPDPPPVTVPSDVNKHSTSDTSVDNTGTAAAVPAPVVKNKRQYRRSFTIQPVETFSSATAEVVEISTQRSSANLPVGISTVGGGEKSTSSLSALLNLTNAAANASKRRLAERLALQKGQKSREQDAGFMLRSIFEFEFLLFDILITQKMTDYMEKEYDILQNKLMSASRQEEEELAMKHKKESAHALTENKTKEEIAVLKNAQMEEKTKLDNKSAEKKRAKKEAFEDARVVTMGKLSAKLEKIREQSADATLSPAGIARIQKIFHVFTTLRNEN